MRLSILDQSVWVAGRGQDDAIRDTLDLAVFAEGLGYHRFWVSEHHALPTIVGTAPEVLMAAIASRTTRIRIGSAGVMLPHYAALKVAEQFRVLDALAPGRIDLGVGRAPGSDGRTARLLNPNVAGNPDDFPQQVQELIAWTRGLPAHGVPAHPLPPEGSGLARAPDVWMLGSSDYGAQLAAHLGLPYAFAYFFMDGQGVEQALHLYRTLYRPSDRHPAPRATICVWALLADTDAEAQRQALSRDRWRLDRARGRLGPLRWPDEIAATGFDEMEQQQLAPMRARSFVGSAATVGAKLRALAAELQLDELVVNTWATDPAVRRHSYALLAREFKLAP
ncbi:LLM class flavin-dependent oxidoreductase [Rubrivivax albus]|uniref:LLM class flavin-dependent oxidoreductase n=1 Tax=Rubrivivax albus TaxID=2499835 RepID=A0A437JS30_9BURK|nr:LLM class flavin-dependent oxidoreductase [Rubrivivax albus]RVT49717.1 LLM class flavin-dependent oxidoreductase [Rubrivivax albus]